MSEPIRISRSELDAPGVDAALAEEAAIRGSWQSGEDGEGEVVGSVKRRGRSQTRSGEHVYITAVALSAGLGLLGAFAGWILVEPLFQAADSERSALGAFFALAVVIAGASAFVAIGDAALSRAWQRAAVNFGAGLLIGLVCGMFAAFVGGILYGLGNVMLIVILQGFPRAFGQVRRLTESSPVPFFLIVANMSIRGFAWAIFGVVAGLTPGIMQRSRTLVMVGILGGLAGGFLGGALFEPINAIMASDTWSRMIGFSCIGLMAGLAIGVVEQLSKDAWLFMEDGPLAGKQFVIYRDPTTIGSSPKSDIYLFKDSEVEPQHAELRRVGASHEICAVGGVPVLVNGKRTNGTRLEDGDEVGIGRARFRYYVRETSRKVH